MEALLISLKEAISEAVEPPIIISHLLPGISITIMKPPSHLGLIKSPLPPLKAKKNL
jgi:hypothetical protein